MHKIDLSAMITYASFILHLQLSSKQEGTWDLDRSSDLSQREDVYHKI